MHRPYRLLLLAGLGLALPAGAVAAPDIHPVVAGFERFYSAPNADAAKGGQLLLGELNCASCHASKDPAVGRKPAPVLDAVGGRVKVGFLRKFLADPLATKPGTTMPSVFANDPERGHKIEALVHFLASTGVLKQEQPDSKAAAAGRKLYGEVGCVACHGTRDRHGRPDKLTAASVPLPDLKAKYSVTSLAAFLADPLHTRPGGRMPRLLQQKEAKEVANYLLQGIRVEMDNAPGTSNYAYYEGEWSKLPDFDKLKPAATGKGPAFDLSAARRESNYALKFDGFFRVDRDGTYRFTLHSDDGTKLWVDGKEVVDNDGIHPATTRDGSVGLTKGVHRVTVGFFQGGGEAELDVQVDGPGIGSQNFAALVAATEAGLERKATPVRKDDPDFIDIQPALAAEGQRLFASSGCANCHQMKVNSKELAGSLKGPALDELGGRQGGCLSESAAKGVPFYGLNPTQKTALVSVLRSPPAPDKSPAALVARTMTTFNCYACHERGKVGGPEEALNQSFQTTQPEMGEEGRVPPSLNNAGAKLNADYMRHLFDQGAHDRPYMLTHMPGFGLANLGGLQPALASLDKFPDVPPVAFPEPLPKVKAAARHLVGDNALGCIKCHTFAGNKAEGVQGIDMTLMPHRLQRDWFHAYLVDPQKVRPGTRMPTAWPDGKSVLPGVLGGKTPVQVDAIWVYLKDGPRALLPAGLKKQSIPLVPEKGAIVYRNFIEGSGPRAIGVGYPEKVHLAFDANDLRLALLWQGAFIDATRHWTDRGAGYEPPLGDDVLSLPAGTSFAVLAKPDQPWPTAPAKEQGWKFRGYKLSPDDRPTFRYSLGDVHVEDFPNPGTGKEPSLVRVLSLSASSSSERLYFRAAAGGKIEPAGDGWYKIDGWKLRLESDAKPELRQSNGKAELLVPVRFKDGKARIVQEFVW